MGTDNIFITDWDLTFYKYQDQRRFAIKKTPLFNQKKLDVGTPSKSDSRDQGFLLCHNKTWE